MMKQKIILLICLGSTSLIFPQTTVCGCGEKKDGLTHEFQVTDGTGGCCGGRMVPNSGFSFEWVHVGNGVYEMKGKGSVNHNAQRDCCEST